MYISESQIASLLTYPALIPAIRQALVDYSTGTGSSEVHQPLRQVIRVSDHTGEPTGWFATMPVIAGNYMAVKTVTFFPGNQPPMPTHQATIELLARSTGQPLATMDGRLITEMRTAAVSAVAAQALAPAAATVGILGSGVQAHSHIEALRHSHPQFRQPGTIRIWSRNSTNAERLADQTGATAVSIEEAAASDIVVTVTSARTPVLEGRWLVPDSLVIAVGAVGPQLRELDDEVMRGTLIAESRQGAENEAGDVLLSGAKVHAELGQILSGSVPVPTGKKVFKSLGMAIEDHTGAVLVWQALNS